MESSFPIPFGRDLSNCQKIMNEGETISFTIDPELLKNIAVYNPITDQFTHYANDMGPIKYVVVMREGTLIDPKELSDYIRQISDN